MDVTSGRRDGSKTDEIYRALRERIRDLKMKPGSFISKEAIADEFAVSRAPVHDALTRLADEGLVEILPQHGSFVTPIRVSDVRESLFTRIALETEAIRHAARTRSDRMLLELEENLRQQEHELAAGNIAEFYKLDESLHTIIFQSMRFNRALRFLETARPLLDRIRPIVLPGTDRAHRTLEEHRRLVEAIRLGDPEFAAVAMRMHLRNVEKTIETWAVMTERNEGLTGAPAKSSGKLVAGD